MSTKNTPFQTVDWMDIPKTEQKGERGVSYWQTLQFDGVRVRLVEYSAGYIANHWYKKGHIVHCLEGELMNEQEGTVTSILKQGMSYIITQDLVSHRSITKGGVKLMIIDGDFLKLKKD